MKKWIIRLVILGIVLFVAAIITLSFNLNRLVKSAIETVGPQVTSVDVGVGSVILLPLSGKGRIGGLHVGNPSGYSSPSAIDVGGASVAIDTGTIMDDKIVIHSITVSNPEITLEGSLKQNNLTKILDNVNAYIAKNSKPSSGSESKGEEGASKALQIDSVSITGAKVHLALPILKGKAVNVPLKDIHLSNLGQGPEGVTAAEVSSQVMDQLLDQIKVLVPQFLASGALEGLGFGADLGKAAGELGLDVGKLGIDLGKTGVGGAGKAAGGAAEGVSKGAESITKGVGGFLKGLKKD